MLQGMLTCVIPCWIEFTTEHFFITHPSTRVANVINGGQSSHSLDFPRELRTNCILNLCHTWFLLNYWCFGSRTMLIHVSVHSPDAQYMCVYPILAMPMLGIRGCWNGCRSWHLELILRNFCNTYFCLIHLLKTKFWLPETDLQGFSK